VTWTHLCLSEATEVLCISHSLSPNSLRYSVARDPRSSCLASTGLRDQPAMLVVRQDLLLRLRDERPIEFAAQISIARSSRSEPKQRLLMKGFSRDQLSKSLLLDSFLTRHCAGPVRSPTRLTLDRMVKSYSPL
jgi:hypothetical protein